MPQTDDHRPGDGSPLAPARDWFDHNVRAGDVTLAAALLLASLVTSFGLTRSIDPWEVLVSVALTVPLCWRRSEPEIVFLVTVFVCLVQVGTVSGLVLADLAVPLVVHATAALSAKAWGLAALGAGIVGAALAAAFTLRYTDPTIGLIGFAAGSVAVLAAYLLGLRSREQRERDAEQRAARTERDRLMAVERDQRAEMSAGAERARIARELHDIVAHSLSVIVVQADGGIAASRARPEVAADVLQTIAETSRDALGEMRRLVGVLRSGGPADADHPDFAPAPGATDIPELVDQVRRAGIPVDLTVTGTARQVGPGAGLTLYRVVQESLTNVIKHAGPGARAEVSVHYGPTDVLVTVLDDGRGAAADLGRDESTPEGNGLLGMRERVALQGGTVAAGPRPGGGYMITAAVPAAADR